MRVPTYQPMLATKWAEAFDDPGWWFEVKWDGYRAIVGCDDDGIRARSRRGLDLTEPFPELKSVPLPKGVVVDAEVVAFDDEGRPSFSRLQQRSGFGEHTAAEPPRANLVVFDLLFEDETLVELPYEERRQRLEHLALPHPIIVPAPTAGSGSALFEVVKEQGIEGIVGKRLGSRYVPGKRSPDWRKVSVRRSLRAVVGGYLPGEGSRSDTFGSILVGLRDGEGLRWVGAVGSGFDQSSLRAFKDARAQLHRDASPFTNEVLVPQEPVWVEPSIVVSVEFKEWTRDNHLRAPVYKGVEMSDPDDVTWEAEGPG